VVEPSDETLCEQVAARDDRAFDLLVARYQERAYRIAWSIVRDADDARDVSQEAFIRLHQNAGRFQRRARFSTWFYRILVNLALDHKRRHRWWRRMRDDGAAPASRDLPSLLERLPSSEPKPDDDAVRRQMHQRLWNEVDQLSPQQRAAILMMLEGLSTNEIAGVLDCAEATVRVHLDRALGVLRKTMGTR
jgi:RNA polymerase sigma-70 factor, ECF subfamily